MAVEGIRIGLLLRLHVVLVLPREDVRVRQLAHDEVIALGVGPVHGREVDAVSARGDVVARGGPVHLDGGVMIAVVVRRPAQMRVDQRAVVVGLFSDPLVVGVLVELEPAVVDDDEVDESLAYPTADVHADGQVGVLA